MPDVTRRDFLKMTTAALLAASGLLGRGGLLRFLDYESEPAPQTEFDAGLASQYPPGSRVVLADVPALLWHTPQGFGALSLVCTHLGCTVEQFEGGLSCPCHGSRYSADGSVLQGPAQKPLRKLRVELAADGHIIVHTD